MFEELINEYSIIEMHADLAPWADLGVGYDNGKNLVFKLTFDRQEEYRGDTPEHWVKRVIIGEKGIDILSDRLHTSIGDLPKTLCKKLGYKGESWSVSDVMDTYHAILNYLEGYRVHYKIKKEDCRR